MTRRHLGLYQAPDKDADLQIFRVISVNELAGFRCALLVTFARAKWVVLLEVFSMCDPFSLKTWLSW